jgi:holin-like protein
MKTSFLGAFTWLLAFQLIGEATSKAFSLPIPGPVLGLVLLVSALACFPFLRALLGQTADHLLAHLSLLFVPAGVGVILYFKDLISHGWALLAVLVVSTWVGLAVTALVAQKLIEKIDAQPSTSDGLNHD